jgi:hypothetical protein
MSNNKTAYLRNKERKKGRKRVERREEKTTCFICPYLSVCCGEQNNIHNWEEVSTQTLKSSKFT